MTSPDASLGYAINDVLIQLAKGQGYGPAKLFGDRLLDWLPDQWSSDLRAAACDELIREYAPRILPENYAAAVVAALDLNQEFGIPTQKERLIAFRRRWRQEHGDDDRTELDINNDDATYEATRQWWNQGRHRLASALSHEVERRNRLPSWPVPGRESIQRIREATSAGAVSATDRPPPAAVDSTDQRERDFREGYVSREKEEQQFRELVAAGAKLIAFVGQPGMGKTWLADAVTGGAPRIRVVSGQVQTLDLTPALMAEGVELSAINSGNPTASLSALLGQTSLRFVILDNLETADELRQLLPASGIRPLVVATCRRIGSAPPVDCRFINVRKMSSPEAVRLVQSELPSLEEDHAAYLASKLDGYPLVLRYACKLLAHHNNISVRQFYADIRADIREIVRHIHTEEGSTLHAVLRRMVDSIILQDRLAYRILVFLTLRYAENRMIEPVLEKVLAFLLPYDSPSRRAQALELLDNFSLIEHDCIFSLPRIDLHPLTREILRQEFKSSKWWGASPELMLFDYPHLLHTLARHHRAKTSS